MLDAHIYNVKKIAEKVRENRKGNKGSKRNSEESEAYTYEKATFVMKGAAAATGTPGLIDEMIEVLESEHLRAIKFLKEEKEKLK